MASNKESVSGAPKSRSEGSNGGAAIAGGSRFLFGLLIFLPVLASSVFFVTRSCFHATGNGQDVFLSGQSKEEIDIETPNIDSTGSNNFFASWNLVGMETSIDEMSKPSQIAAVLGQQAHESGVDKSLSARKILTEEQHEERSTELAEQESDAASKLDNAYMEHSELLDSSVFENYSRWKKENENKNLDSTIRLMRDQIIMARVYLNILRKNKKVGLYQELQIRIKKSSRALGEANVDTELHDSAPDKINAMDKVLSKARNQLFECELVSRRLRAMLLTEEEKVRAWRKKNTFLTQLGVKGIPGALRCLSLRLTTDYFLLPPEKRAFPRSENLEHPDLYHYALFSDNVLAAAVVVNSTVVNAKDSSKHVFHLVTDSLNFAAMNMWFLLNPPEDATIHVENLDEFEWLNSFYCPVLRQLKSSAMKEYYFKRGNTGASNLMYRNPKYLSMLNHLRFYLPQIYPKLDKILFLDDDIVVQKDLSELWSVDLKGKVNGAVETCVENLNCFDNYLNFSNPLIAGEFDPNACGWAYGMNIFDLKEWKNRNITDIYHKWQNLNEDRLLWKLGTLPPGLLTFNGLTHTLDKSWHVLGLGYNPSVDQSDIENAAVIHYNGIMKPWLEMAITKYRPHWTKYIDHELPYLHQCHFIR